MLGISIDKEFMPSVANIIGTDLTKYYVIRKNRFAFNPMHVGRDERLPISCYKRENPALVSPAYQMFEITDDNINSDYLMLVFKSSEFDRNCWFHTDSSVRGGISWNDFCKMEINVPDIAEQERVVKIYNVINNRIKILNALNKNLEEQAQTIFKHWFIDFEFPNEEGQPYKSSAGKMIWNEELQKKIPEGWVVKSLADITDFINGYSYTSSEFKKSKLAMVTIKNFDRNGGFKIDGYKELIPKKKIRDEQYIKLFDIIVAHTDLTQNAEIIGNAEIVLSKYKYEYIICSMDIVKLKPKCNISNFLIMQFLKDSNFKTHCLKYVNGTTVLHLNKKALPEYKICLPFDLSILSPVVKIFSEYYNLIANYFLESQKLAEFRELLLPKLLS